MEKDRMFMKSFLTDIKNVLLWSYERGSWQYDLLCLLIVATIFLMPGHYFGDRDRPPTREAVAGAPAQANNGHQSASKTSEATLEISLVELQAFLQKKNRAELMDSLQEALIVYLQDQFGRDVTLVRYEQFTNSSGQTAYRVWYK
jgi:hypothetical protein